MFARNEKVYGVQTSFVEDLSQYTCKLERRDSAEFKYDRPSFPINRVNVKYNLNYLH
jgi:PAB1-binding protein PBP1